MDQYEFIRIAYRTYGDSITEISKKTGHARNTVKKALRNEMWGYTERENQPFPVLGPYLKIIDTWLERDKQQPKKQRHTARRIYNRLVTEHGFEGAESTVRHYVRHRKIALGVTALQAYIPSDPEAGIEAEVDWGIAKAIIAANPVWLKFFCMRSKYSGKHFVRFYPCERQQAFFDAHIHAFAFFGGVFPVLIYDNLTSAVRKVLHGRGRVEQESFSKFKAYYNFESRFCNPAKGNEKGGVEGLVGFARRNYMVPIPEADSIDELNELVLKQCIAYGNHKIDGREQTVNKLHEMETAQLIPLPDTPFSNVQVTHCKINKYATAAVDKNRYSVPSDYAGFKAKVLLFVDRVEIFICGKKQATHQRVYGNNKWCLKPEHYLKLIQQRPMSFNSARPIRQWQKTWPQSLHRLLARFRETQGETKGTRDFISVLMLYSDYPADDIEAAVTLSLDNKLSSSDAVRHLLVYTNDTSSSIAPLTNWPSLPSPDISVYRQLGDIR